MTKSVSRERIRFCKRTYQARKRDQLSRSARCSSPFRSTHPGTRNTGGVSQRRTERLIAGDVLSDGFVEPTCGIENTCCALQRKLADSLPIQQIITYPATRGIERCAFSSLARGPLADISAAGCCKPAATSPFWCGRTVPRSLPPQAS